MKVASPILLSGMLLLGACTVPTGPVEVTVFNRVNEGVAYGQGAYAVKLAPDASGGQGLSSTSYLAAVAREMRRVGYVEILGDPAVTAEVRVDRQEYKDGRSPVSVGGGASTGSYGSGAGLGLSVDLTGGKHRMVTTLGVRIIRNSDNAVIWEGRAEQDAKYGSPAAQPGIAASKLAEALFKDFPGKSGQTIKVP